MLKPLVVATVLLVMLLGSSGIAAAGSPPGCTRGWLGGGVACSGGTSAGSGGATPPPPPNTPPSGPGSQPSGVAADVVDIARVSSHDGKECYVLIPVNTAGLSSVDIAAIEAGDGAIELALPACPNQPTGAAAVPQPTPTQVATKFWDTIRLPVPRPTTRPDYAITGKLTYLQAGDTNTPAPWTRQTPFGPLTITAHGTYTVNWGDATPTSGPYTNPGGPYPSGTITHTYDNTGTVTITVHEAWTATWNIGTFHGTLRDLHTTGTDPGFVIRQIQAVITGSS